MSAAWRWWRERTTAERLDLPTRWSLLVISGCEPLILLLLIGARPHARAPGAAALLLVSVLHAVACVLLLHAGLAHVTGGRRPTRRLLGAAAALTGAGVAAGAGALPGYLRLVPDSPDAGYPVVVEAVLLFCGAFTVALTPLLRTPALLVALLLPAAGLLAVQFAGTSSDDALEYATTYVFFVGGLLVTYRFSIWSLGLICEIDRSREAQARLAVAEERLRFARDLHDVLGRNLSLIAVKSDLAAQLTRRGQSGAVEQMLEVRQVAQDSMREVREVVGGYRDADLDTELAGARSVLASAGVTARVIGDGADLPRAVQAALGWVVREATTNIIRHSEATTARIELDVSNDDGPGSVAVLRIENDGVRPPAAPVASDGTGLVGLRERLAGLGGQLTATALAGARFRVEARLPITGASSPSPRGDSSTAEAVH